MLGVIWTTSSILTLSLISLNIVKPVLTHLREDNFGAGSSRDSLGLSRRYGFLRSLQDLLGIFIYNNELNNGMLLLFSLERLREKKAGQLRADWPGNCGLGTTEIISPVGEFTFEVIAVETQALKWFGWYQITACECLIAGLWKNNDQPYWQD